MANRKTTRAGAKSAPAPAAPAQPATTAMCKIPLDVRTREHWLEYEDPWAKYSPEGRKAAVRAFHAKQCRDAYTGEPPEGMSKVENAKRRSDALIANGGPTEGRATRSAEWRALAAQVFKTGKASEQEVAFGKLSQDKQAAFNERVAENIKRAQELAAAFEVDL